MAASDHPMVISLHKISVLGCTTSLNQPMLRAVHGPPIKGRLIQLWMYKRSSPNDNHYAHPLDFVPFVDLNLRKARASRTRCLA